MKPSAQPDSAARRDTLGMLLWGALGIVVAPAAYVAARFVAPPAKQVSQAMAGSPAEIGAEGRILKVGTTDAIVLRDSGNELYALDLRCTHAGCTVRWRPAERTFACPCHGGRFDSAGDVLEGPPKRPLVQLELRTEGGQVVVTDSPVPRRA